MLRPSGSALLRNRRVAAKSRVAGRNPRPGWGFVRETRGLNQETDLKMAGKRELIAPRGDKRYIRRDKKGRIKESDDVSRSLSQDRRRAAKTVAKPGQGDRGDRKAAARSGRK
jgi:hypothetical protein